MAVWPSDLPFFHGLGGERKVTGDNVIESPVDIGEPKRRRRSTISRATVSGNIPILTVAQMDQFRAFFHDTLKDGVLSFTHTDPYTRLTRTYSMRDGFTEYEIGNKYRVQAMLKVRI